MPRAIIGGQAVSAALHSAGATNLDPFGGTGSLGDVVITGITNAAGILNYNNLTIQDGARLAALPGEKLQVRVRGNLVIHGSGRLHADGRGGSGAKGGKGGSGGLLPGEGLTAGSTINQISELRTLTAGGGGGGGGCGAQADVAQVPASAGAAGLPRQIFASTGAGSAGAGAVGAAQPGAAGSAAIALSGSSRDQILTDLRSGHQGARALFALYSCKGGAGGAGGAGTGGGSSLTGGPVIGSFVGGAGGLPDINEEGYGGPGAPGGAFSSSAPGGGGGASGSGGGWLLVEVAGDITLEPGARISANGGFGGPGGSGGTATVPGGGGGGGGGGAGGVVAVYFAGAATNVSVDTITATSGAGGAPGTAPGAGAGAAGGAGEPGYAVFQQVA